MHICKIFERQKCFEPFINTWQNAKHRKIVKNSKIPGEGMNSFPDCHLWIISKMILQPWTTNSAEEHAFFGTWIAWREVLKRSIKQGKFNEVSSNLTDICWNRSNLSLMLISSMWFDVLKPLNHRRSSMFNWMAFGVLQRLKLRKNLRLHQALHWMWCLIVWKADW